MGWYCLGFSASNESGQLSKDDSNNRTIDWNGNGLCNLDWGKVDSLFTVSKIGLFTFKIGSCVSDLVSGCVDGICWV